MRRRQTRNHLHALLRPATLNHQVTAMAQSQGWQLAGPFGCLGHNWHGPLEAHEVVRFPEAYLICLMPLQTMLHLWAQCIAPAALRVFSERTGGEVRDERGGWMEERWRMDCGKHLFTTANACRPESSTSLLLLSPRLFSPWSQLPCWHCKPAPAEATGVLGLHR